MNEIYFKKLSCRSFHILQTIRTNQQQLQDGTVPEFMMKEVKGNDGIHDDPKS